MTDPRRPGARVAMADHLAHAASQIETACWLGRTHGGTLTAGDLGRLEELRRAVAVAAENVRDSRDGIHLDRDGRPVWGPMSLCAEAAIDTAGAEELIAAPLDAAERRVKLAAEWTACLEAALRRDR